MRKPSAAGTSRAERAVAHDDEVAALGRLDELCHALLRDEPADEEELGRLGLAVGRRGGDLDAVADHAHVRRAEPADGVGNRVGHGYGDADTPDQQPQERREALQKRNVGAVQRGHERAPGGQGRGDRGQPVRVHQVGAASGPPNRPGHGGE